MIFGAGVTVSVAHVPVVTHEMRAAVATMVVTPALSPVARPDESIVAIDVSVLCHATTGRDPPPLPPPLPPLPPPPEDTAKLLGGATLNASVTAVVVEPPPCSSPPVA